MLESAQLGFDRWMVTETGAIKQRDSADDLVLLGIQSVAGHAGDVDHVGRKSAVRRRGTPAERIHVQRMIDRADEVARRRGFGFPSGRDGPFLGVNVCEAERLELLDGPGGGTRVVGRAGQAWADS